MQIDKILTGTNTEIHKETVQFTPLPDGRVKEECIASEVYASGTLDEVADIYLDLPKRLREEHNAQGNEVFSQGSNVTAYFDKGRGQIQVYTFVDENTRNQLRQFIAEKYGSTANIPKGARYYDENNNPMFEW